MVASIFQPALTEKVAASIERTTGWSNTQWGLGLALNRDDCPGRRRKNSGFCTFGCSLFQQSNLYSSEHVFVTGYGFAGTYYFIDPTSGIAAVCHTQILPTLDSEVLKVWQEAEEALYAQWMTSHKL
jgi:methyl acetate hydrolase